MSRQVIIGAVVGFLVTVTLMAVCQQKPGTSPNSDAPPDERVDLQPVRADPPGGQVLQAPIPLRPPFKSLPSTDRPLNLRGFDAGRR